MDSARFDALLRSFNRGSRRATFRLLAGAVMGGLVPRLVFIDANAKRKRKKRKKKNQKALCTPTCDGRPCGDDGCGASCGSCGTGSVCAEGSCLCLSGYKACQGACIPQSDCCTAADCPAGSGRTCQSGSCLCPNGQQDSGGVCADPPPCRGAGGSCPFNGIDTSCCSNFCFGPTNGCSFSEPGEHCHMSSDCAAGGTCSGFVCRVP
jgi:hypothetical protein